MKRTITEYTILFKVGTEGYNEYGEFTSEEKEETDGLFEEYKNDIEQYFSKEWHFDGADWVEGYVEVFYSDLGGK